SIYSDLDFILLGFLAEDRVAVPFAQQFDAVVHHVFASARMSRSLENDVLTFRVTADARERSAPTRALDEDERRGQVLVGRVHDEYADRLNGVAGHSGVFGTVGAVGAFAQVMLRAARGDRSLAAPFTPQLVAETVRKSDVPQRSRALGWDTMLPTSSCGTEMSPAAFGHVGFTGTSLWIDPVLDRYFVLLTNRACDGGTSEEMQTVRRSFHDVVAKL